MFLFCGSWWASSLLELLEMGFWAVLTSMATKALWIVFKLGNFLIFFYIDTGFYFKWQRQSRILVCQEKSFFETLFIYYKLCSNKIQNYLSQKGNTESAWKIMFWYITVLLGLLSSLCLRGGGGSLKQEVIIEGFVFRKSFNVINE